MPLVDARVPIPVEPKKAHGHVDQKNARGHVHPKKAHPHHHVETRKTPAPAAKPPLTPEEERDLERLTLKQRSGFNKLEPGEPETLRALQQKQKSIYAPKPVQLTPQQQLAQQVPPDIKEGFEQQLTNIDNFRQHAQDIGMQYRDMEARYNQLASVLPMVSEQEGGEPLQQFNALGDTMSQLSTQMADVQRQITNADTALNGQIAEYLKQKDPTFEVQDQKVQDLTGLTGTLDNVSKELANGGKELPYAIKTYNDALFQLASRGSLVSFGDRITQPHDSGFLGEELGIIKDGLQSKLNTNSITYSNHVRGFRLALLGR
jgi:hypothetical protein